MTERSPADAARPDRLAAALRLDHLEEDLREVRTRVNALFFTAIAVVLGDVLGRVVLS